MKWLTQQFGRALVRRVAFIVVAAVLAFAGMGRAHAACNASTCDTREEAYAYVDAVINQWIADNPPNPNSPSTKKGCIWLLNSRTYRGVVTIDSRSCPADLSSQNPNPTYASSHRAWSDPECPVGTEWNDELKQCFDPSQCLAKSNLGNSQISGHSSTACSDGCQYAPESGNVVSISFGGSTETHTPSGNWAPTGGSCDVGDPTPSYDAECQNIGVANQTVCVLSDGRYCPSTSSDRSICWSPGETGEKIDIDYMQKTNAGDQIIPPSLSLPSGDTLAQSGDPLTTTVTEGSKTTTTTTTNYKTEFGTNAGDKNQGGDGGSGSGSSSGDGSGDGEGDGPGGTSDGVGTLYEGSDKTVDGVMAEFRSQAMQSTLFGSITGFMGDCAFGGTCPVWSYDGGEYMGKVTFDGLCSGSMQSLFSYGGFIVMALAAFAAFRVAIY